MRKPFAFTPRRRALAAGSVVVLMAFVALLCSAGVARAATAPDFYVDTIAEGVGSGPTWVEAIDVTGDGELDLVTALSGTDSVSVRAGDGDGHFGAASTFACGGDNPYSLDVAELTGDGVLDIAVANRTSHTVTLLPGLGAGVFGLAQTLDTVGTENIDVKALDLDQDGDNDLAATQMWSDPYTNGKLWLLYNQGSSVFWTVDMPLPFIGSTVMGVGDLNKDNAPDIAVGHGYPADPPDPAAPGTTESILLNDNAGSHVDPVTLWPTTNLVLQPALTVGNYPQGAAFADFNGDLNMDMCITSRYPNYARIFLGDGTGAAFTGPTNNPVGAYPKVPVAADLNNDGDVDIVICNYGNEGGDPPGTTISILMGNGDGTFSAASAVDVGLRPHSVAAGDFNDDGWMDLAIPNWASHDVSVLTNMSPYASDLTDPVTTISPDDANWHPGPVTVTLTATDAGSGVGETWHQIGGGAWTLGKSFSVAAEGDNTVKYYSVDKMGNEESVHTAHIKVDATLPVVTLTKPAAGASYAQNSGNVSSWTSSDTPSGVASESATLDGVTVAKGAAIDTGAAGKHTFVLTVTDVAGNVRTVTSEYTITVAGPTPPGPTPPTTLKAASLKAPSLQATVTWGGSTVLSAMLTDGASGAALNGRSVQVEWSLNKVDWTLLRTVTSDAGACKASVQPVKRTYYRFRFLGDTSYAAAASEAIAVSVKPAVGKPSVPASVKSGARFTASGTLKPRFASGSKTVKVKVYRYRSGKWVLVKQYSAVNANSGSYSKYSVKIRLTTKGKYRFKAATAATATWAAATTAYSRTLVVK